MRRLEINRVAVLYQDPVSDAMPPPRCPILASAFALALLSLVVVASVDGRTGAELCNLNATAAVDMLKGKALRAVSAATIRRATCACKLKVGLRGRAQQLAGDTQVAERRPVRVHDRDTALLRVSDVPRVHCTSLGVLLRRADQL